MSAREQLLASVRRGLGVTGHEATRRQSVMDRLAIHSAGVVPSRGHLPPKERQDLFVAMVERAAGTITCVAGVEGVPTAIADFLRRHNLPMRVQRGRDPYLVALPWHREAALTVDGGPVDPASLAAVSHAMSGVAETGTVALASGPANPTSLNFLPDNHIVVLAATDIVSDFETTWQRLRAVFGAELPRCVNLVTGPSRTADIEQTLIIGAHGPRRLHVIVVGDPE
jgi:L-lactate dehydrogenase complex protein LldG